MGQCEHCLDVREQNRKAMRVHPLTVGNLIAVIIRIANQNSIGFPEPLDITVTVANGEGHRPVIGFHRPSKHAEFILTGKELLDLRDQIKLRKAFVERAAGSLVQLLIVAHEGDLPLVLIEERDKHRLVGDGKEPA